MTIAENELSTGSDETNKKSESLITEEGLKFKTAIETAIKSKDKELAKQTALDLLNTIYEDAYGSAPARPIPINSDQIEDMLDFGKRTEGLMFPPGTEGQRIFFKKFSFTAQKSTMFYPKPRGSFGLKTWEAYMKMFGSEEVPLDLG